MRCCEQCAKLIVDMDALKNGLLVEKCDEFNYHVYCPFLSGWSCPRYLSKNRKKDFSLFERLKKKFLGK